MAKLKQGDFVFLENHEIQRHIELLLVNGYTLDATIGIANKGAVGIGYFKEEISDNHFIDLIYPKHRMATLLSRNDWVCAVIGLEVGMGMRSDTSTHEQRMHITVELGKLGIVSLIDPTERDYSYSFKINNTYKWVANMSVDNNIPYSDWCKKLGIEPIHATSVNNAHVENIITLPDGTKVDLTKPLEYRNDESENWIPSKANWLKKHYIGINGFDKKLVFFDEKHSTCFISVFIRNTPEPKFKEGDPVFINEFGKWVFYRMKYNVTYSGEIIPAINPDGTPNFPPFND